MNLQYLIKYKSFATVSEMDAAVQTHIQTHNEQLPQSAKAVLYCLAKHSLTAIGACHLKVDTIASEIGLSEKTVYRATKKLTDLGIITKHKTVKRTGQGASIYVIAPNINTRNVSHVMSASSQSLETHVKPVTPTVTNEISNTVTKNLSTSSFNPCIQFVNKNVNAPASQDIKSVLKEIYSPQSVEGNKKFDELCKIAFGRLKQYMKSHSVPYFQMVDIITNCMRQLVAKQNVRNEFAMYSVMIKRQVEQLFEQPIQPQRTITGRTEMVPEWMSNPQTVEQQNEQELQHQHNELMRRFGRKPSADNSEVDFEAERAKVLAKLQGAI